MSAPTVYRNALAPQSMLHEYRLESVLGAGSFGVTYLGWDTHLEKHVAIKEYLPTELAMRAADGSVVPLTTQAEAGYKWGLERYLQEARTLAKFSHPNIVRVNRYFEANATGYMVMDYERGESLAAQLKRTPRPDEAVLKRMLGSLLEGLQAVHAAGFLHRDIKPDNILLRVDGTPALIDFGAARQSVGGATKTLTAVLTPGYAPLEQYLGEGHQGPWTDLYALACVLYRAVTDETPPDAVRRLKGDQVGETLARARDRYSGHFLNTLQWALAPEERKRPQSVEEWQRVLSGAPLPAVTGQAPTVRVSPPEKPAVQALQRPVPVANRGAPAARPPDRAGWPWVRAVALLLVAVAIFGFWHQHRAARERAARSEAPTAAAGAAPVQASVAAQAASGTAPVQAAIGAQAVPLAAIAEPAVAPQAPAPQNEQSNAAPQSPLPADERMERLRREADKQFRWADADGDGYLSRREVREHFPRMARIFDQVDTDGDGRISFDEFLKFRAEQLERKAER